ncbi:hypothetical protein V2I01_31065 [Micromonospora sp. BRA006-A]|nr:hypothetical protein [Micromonospora sp. BRA006-A]
MPEAGLAPWVDVDPAALLTGADAAWADRPELARPVRFAVGVALAAVWRHAGVTPPLSSAPATARSLPRTWRACCPCPTPPARWRWAAPPPAAWTTTASAPPW